MSGETQMSRTEITPEMGAAETYAMIRKLRVRQDPWSREGETLRFWEK